jgi:opacity protein-like surface antigen
MKHSIVMWALLSVVTLSYGQKGFGLDGSLGLGMNGSEMINPLLLEGRVQWNDYVSTNLGLGLWNSGYKSVWNSEVGSKATIYKLTDNKAFPSIQLGLTGQYPLGALFGHDIHLFLEPKLIFLPFSSRTTYLNELYYTISTVNGKKVYTPGASEDNVKTSYTSESRPRLYYGILGGLSVNVIDNFDLSIGYGYSNIDLFKDLRGQNIKGFNLNNYIPKTGMMLLNITIKYNYNLN